MKNPPQVQRDSVLGRIIECWYGPKFRSIIVQILVFGLIVGGIINLFTNAYHNLQDQGTASGFGFLDDTAGFGVITSIIEYSETSSYGRAFFVGLTNTLCVSVLGIILATVLGFLIGIARLSSNWLVAKIASFYVETVRNIALLLQIFFWYFAVLRTLPSPRQSFNLGEVIFINKRGLYIPEFVLDSTICAYLFVCIAILILGWFLSIVRKQYNLSFPNYMMKLVGVMFVGLLYFIWQAESAYEVLFPVLRGFNFEGGIAIIPEFIALLLSLSIYTAAFIAEIVRSGIQAVGKGQYEASYSLGLSRWQTLKHVTIPQAMRVIIPPLTSQYLNLTKNSSLATAIGYPDLVAVFAGTVLNQTGQAVEVILMTMAVFLTISLTISVGMNLYNKVVML